MSIQRAGTLGARDFSCAISGFGQAVFIMTRAFPNGRPEASYRLREKNASGTQGN